MGPEGKYGYYTGTQVVGGTTEVPYERLRVKYQD